jgi:4-hydroxy-tetrahydrodipicolinate reductase
MVVDIIVMGAAGRMGATVARLAGEASDLRPAGAVESPERLHLLRGLSCPTDTDVEALLQRTPGATVIDFTAPSVSLAVARAAAEHGAVHVIGTTGFSPEEKAELESQARRTPIFLSPNMSVGVNVLLKLLPELARALGDAYDIEVLEIHHNKKKDAPSGTALRLAECLAEARGMSPGAAQRHCRDGLIGERPKEEIGVQTLRGGDVVGVHTVYFMGPGERVEVTHQAHSRENFASGALFAARRMQGRKPGKLYGMQDLL